MLNRVIVSGFGGQGVMLIGQILGVAANEAGKEALFLPHYGPEQRGGTANCTLTISDGPIGAPTTKQADVVIAMNMPSVEKFKGSVKPEGALFVNAKPQDTPIETAGDVYFIPVDDMADALGSRKVANIIMLGAYIEKTKALTEDEVFSTLQKKLSKKPEMIALNQKALRAGMDFVKNWTKNKA